MKKYYILILMFIPLFINAKVTCTSGEYIATIDADYTTIKANQSTKINVNANTDDYKINYQVLSNDILKVDGEGNVIPINYGIGIINVNVIFMEDNNEITSCSSDIEFNILSNNNYLKELIIDEYDMSNIFKSDVYEYDILIPSDVLSINIKGAPLDDNSVVTGNGIKYLSSENTFYISVKAPDDTTRTYTLNIKKDKPDEENKLQNLIVKGYSLTPAFNKDINEYSIGVNENIDKINIDVIPINDKEVINGIGEYKLATGMNEINIKVKSEAGKENNYKLIINKSSGNCLLNNLEIENYNINFTKENFLYEIEVKEDINELNIKANSDDKIEILGNNLKYGHNEILIKVSNKNKITSTYKIIVNKLYYNNLINKSSILTRILLIIFIISVIVMFGSIFIFIKRNKLIKIKRKKVK